MNYTDKSIAVIGLGYVGLPLAIEFAKKYKVTGYDINIDRVNELNNSIDKTLEADIKELSYVLELNHKGESKGIFFSSDLNQLKDCNIFIVTVPTPIDKFKTPDLRPLLSATEMLSTVIKKNDIIIYESTVYPGCTEEECVPLIEKKTGLKYNVDFFCGYSPERINPGDKINTLTSVVKVTSGSNEEISETVDYLYKSIITAGTFRANSIKVAEASKAIENAQRDLNISFVNELALIFDKMDIDTTDVLMAASTKWNFLNFKPGLVGGHCIGVDPYYLAHKAESIGYHPQVILAGRRVNDNMGYFVANKVIKLLIAKGHTIRSCNVLILGFTFKDNCPDTRNTRVIDIYSELKEFNIQVDIYDPYANPEDVYDEYKVELLSRITSTYDAIILAVAHNEFLQLDICKLKSSDKSVVYDVKSFLERKLVDSRL